MSTYLIINIGIIIFPLLYSFEKSISYYKKYHAILISTIIVGIPFIVWDIFATQRGDWSFNPKYISGIYFAGLPIEELLFFITVPYSMIFLYEIAKHYLPSRKIKLGKKLIYSIVIILLISAAYNYSQYYTYTVMIFCAFTFFIIGFSKLAFTKESRFWIYITLAFFPFVLTNYFLTSLPVVQYNPESFSEIRITTIPLEDFFYSFALVTNYIYVYELVKSKLEARKIEEII